MDFWTRLDAAAENYSSKRELCEKVGISPNSFTNWRKRKTIPSGTVIARLAEELGVSVEFLLTGDTAHRSSIPLHIPSRESAFRKVEAPILGGHAVLKRDVSDWVGSHRGLVDGLMRLDPARVELLEQAFLNASGHVIDADNYDLASHVPQRISAGPGEFLLDFQEEDLISRAPYPAKWGKGLLCAEVVGDSMTGANIFDGDLVYFRPGEIRGNGLYVLQLNGTALVKRLEFDDLSGRLTIISENPRYQQKQESSDSQAISILGKVRGWMHGHPY